MEIEQNKGITCISYDAMDDDIHSKQQNKTKQKRMLFSTDWLSESNHKRNDDQKSREKFLNKTIISYLISQMSSFNDFDFENSHGD